MASFFGHETIYFIGGSLPLLVSLLVGALLLLIFQYVLRYRNFFGLAFLALPGFTLLIFGMVGSVYSFCEIQFAIEKANSLPSKVLKENESTLVQLLRVGSYLEAGKILDELRTKAGIQGAQLFLVPSDTLVSSIGSFTKGSEYKSIAVESADIDGANVIWGKINFQVNPVLLRNSLQEISKRWQSSMAIVAIAILLSTLIIAFYFFRHLRRPSLFVGALKSAVDKANTGEQLISGIKSVVYENPFLDEEIYLRNNLQQIVDSMVNLNSKWMKNEGEAVVGRLAEQVAHDIRSPLSALNMIASTLKDIPEEKSKVIQNAILRINEIANDLLSKNSPLIHSMSSEVICAQKIQVLERSSALNCLDLLPIIERIILEKRMLFCDNINFEIESDFSQSDNALIIINTMDFERILSNLINNAVEAMPNYVGKVVVAVKEYGEKVLVVISDNGKGMSKNVLERLGEKGFSHGKDIPGSGSGLGIFHAQRTVNDWGGKLHIRSSEGIGTMVELSLPREKN